MRLRKHASKLLGWAYSSQFHSSSFSEAQHCWPPPPESAGSDSDELHCQLNQSPWDAIENPQRTNSQVRSLPGP
ncbi:hypothetical protein KSP40_PGU010465 [Platanthera guangdongensis]|uniref:Uncharacterized protein n=1 Tax=Platanthera guangdongensis TaxID=2320717 RepID=A0ABR2LZ74_9ASPA